MSVCPRCGADLELVGTVAVCSAPQAGDPSLDCGWHIDLSFPNTEYELSILETLTTDTNEE